MKLHSSIQTKNTTKLFNNKYKYKIVLRLKTASWFRGADLDHVMENASQQGVEKQPTWVKQLTKEDYAEAVALCLVLKKFSDYQIRVESPLLSFYTNTESQIEKLAKLNPLLVKYVSFPEQGTESILDEHKVIVKNIDYAYKITIGRTRQNFSNFVEWCEGKDKIRMPKRAKKDLSKNNCWGGSHFYVKDEKTLTMVKMFVGNCIHSVESVVKS